MRKSGRRTHQISASIGSFSLESTRLSQITGDPKYYLVVTHLTTVILRACRHRREAHPWLCLHLQCVSHRCHAIDVQHVAVHHCTDVVGTKDDGRIVVTQIYHGDSRKLISHLTFFVLKPSKECLSSIVPRVIRLKCSSPTQKAIETLYGDAGIDDVNARKMRHQAKGLDGSECKMFWYARIVC